MPVMVDRGTAPLVFTRVQVGMESLKVGPRLDDDTGPLPDTPLAWAETYRRIDNLPFSLDRFEPLRAIYLDDHPHIVVMKPAQRGVSEWAINYTCFALDRGAEAWDTGKDGLNVGYLFPTQTALSDFSKERFSGVRDESPYLSALFRGEDFEAVSFKKVRQSYLYLRGTWSESQLLSFAADVLVLDEFDRMDVKAIALARRRLNASTVRRELDISTPTLPGTGVHALYLQSDRREYEQRCPTCGEWIVVEFFDHVRADGEPYVLWKTWQAEQLRRADLRVWCPSCDTPWPDEARWAPGRWVARASEMTGLRGYRMPPLAFPFVRLIDLALAAVSQDPSEVEEFYRSDLGLPHAAGGGGLSVDQVLALAAIPPMASGHELVTMGVDVGSRFHYRVSGLASDGRVDVLAAGNVATWQEVDILMARHRVVACVVDAQPEQHGARAFADRHPGRVLVAFYPGPAALRGELFRVKTDEPVIQINRTMAADGLYAAVVTAAERWPESVVRDTEVLAHLTAPTRVTSQDAHGQPRADWVHSKPDHIFHASIYDRAARAVLESAVAGEDEFYDERVEIGPRY